MANCKRDSCSNEAVNRSHGGGMPAVYCSPNCRKRASEERLRGTGGPYQPARAPKGSHPRGWEPGIELSGDRGTITTPPTTETQPDFAGAFEALQLDPAEYEILEPVNLRTWQVNTSEGIQTLRYFRANVRRRTGARDPDVDQLIENAKYALMVSPEHIAGETADEHSLLVAPADWQLGKRDGGGIELVIERALELPHLILERLEALRRYGYTVNHIVLPFMGDLTEGCQGQYAMQTFQAELDQRSQDKLARRLALQLISTLAQHAEHVTVLTLPGNHGENRIGGKSFTTFGDNRDIAVIEQVAEVTQAGGLDNVTYVIPEEQMELTLDVHGTIVGFAHGHQAGKVQPQRVLEWWKGQMMGQQPIGDADILLTAHFHHLRVIREGARTWFQCPALENESTWYKHQAGVVSPPGTLSLLVGPDGWSKLEVL